jgi:hypothetical protein
LEDGPNFILGPPWAPFVRPPPTEAFPRHRDPTRVLGGRAHSLPPQDSRPQNEGGGLSGWGGGAAFHVRLGGTNMAPYWLSPQQRPSPQAPTPQAVRGPAVITCTGKCAGKWVQRVEQSAYSGEYTGVPGHNGPIPLAKSPEKPALGSVG